MRLEDDEPLVVEIPEGEEAAIEVLLEGTERHGEDCVGCQPILPLSLVRQINENPCGKRCELYGHDPADVTCVLPPHADDSFSKERD